MDGVRIERGEGLDEETRAFVDAEWTRIDSERGQTYSRDPAVLVARRDGKIEGAAVGWTGMGVAYLSNLIVAGDVRGQGLGSRLLVAFEDLVRERGLSRMGLLARDDSPAQRLYERHGWYVEARVSDWYHGQTFAYMRKDLDT